MVLLKTRLGLIEKPWKSRMDKKTENNGIVEVDGDEEISASRRKFVQAAGKIAVYTPPAMMLLMNPSAEAFAKSAGMSEVGPARRRRRRRRRRRNGE